MASLIKQGRWPGSWLFSEMLFMELVTKIRAFKVKIPCSLKDELL
jgi:hypothetical protein